MILGKIILSLSGILIFLLIASIYLVFFYQNPPIIIINDPVPTQKQVYRPGDHIIIHVEADVRSQSPSRTTVRWNSGTPGEPPHPVSELPVGGLPLGRDERDLAIAIVPLRITPGIYRLQMDSIYDVHFLPGSQREVTWYTQAFEVIAASPPEPTIIIQDVERPVYVFEYIYVDGPPTSITVPSVEGNAPFLVSFPTSPIPESPTMPPSSNDISAPPSDSAPAPPDGSPTPSPPESPPPEPPKPVIIVIITPEPINVPPPTHREEAHERRDDHKAEIEQRQEEHRAAIEEKKEAKQASKH